MESHINTDSPAVCLPLGLSGLLICSDKHFLLSLSIMGISSLLGRNTHNPSTKNLPTLLAKSLDLAALDIRINITGQIIGQATLERINHTITIKIISNNIDSKRKLLHSKPFQVSVINQVNRLYKPHITCQEPIRTFLAVGIGWHLVL